MHGLTPRGVKQVVSAARALRNDDVEFDAWLWPSVTTNSMETAEVLAYELKIRRERIVPEYAFLDARGLGTLDGKSLSLVHAALANIDKVDVDMKPEPTDDGTPNDSVSDVFVRVRQLLSKLETQYFGERIVIIAPDSEPLSILQAALMDIDLRDHYRFRFAPGELRAVVAKVIDPLNGKPVFEPIARVLSRV